MLSMLLPDDQICGTLRRAGLTRPLPGGTFRYPLRSAVGTAILLLTLAGGTVAQAGGKVRLVRKYRPGQTIIYVTKVSTNSKFNSNPPELKSFFPPMPTSLHLNTQSTVTVSKVNPDGAADVQHHFDMFEIQTDLGALPENIRDSVTQAQQEVSQRMVGQTLTAHYDHDGQLVDFDGADDFFRGIDASVRDPLLQMFRVFLEQMGGQSLYPDHRVKVGEEWPQNLDAQPLKNYPFLVQGKSILRYSGKTRYQGVKAAMVDYHVENTITPAVEGLRKGGALPQLEAMGMHLDIKTTGKGEGRILVALDDGRILQNHYTMHQSLTALMKGREGSLAPAELLPRLEIQSDTEMEVEGSKP
jgi:hypothetical protein